MRKGNLGETCVFLLPLRCLTEGRAALSSASSAQTDGHERLGQEGVGSDGGWACSPPGYLLAPLPVFGGYWWVERRLMAEGTDCNTLLSIVQRWPQDSPKQSTKDALSFHL